MTSWKAPGPDGVSGFWYKKLSKLHGKIAIKLQKILESGRVPTWLMIGATVLIMKDPKKGKVTSNHRPIAYLLLMWKLLTRIFVEKICNHQDIQNMLLPNEQKAAGKNQEAQKSNC